jgi:hypothetical protein
MNGAALPDQLRWERPSSAELDSAAVFRFSFLGFELLFGA